MQKHAAHNPDRGRIGDCVEACLASQLDLPLHAVPRFSEGLERYTEGDMGANIEQWLKRAREWLAPMGLSLWVQWERADTVEGVLKLMGRANPDIRYILGGGSKTMGVNHTVCCKGGEIEHDPNPRAPATGLSGPLWPHRKVFGILVLRETV